MRKTIVTAIAMAVIAAPALAELKADRPTLIKLATSWGWTCKAPTPAEIPGGTTEAVTCRNPANLDTLTIYGGAAATRLIAYYGDQSDAARDEPAVTQGRLTQVAKLIGVEALDKDVRQAVQKQRKFAEEQSCSGAKCPNYDETRKAAGVAIRLWAKPKTAWRWEITAE